MLSAIAKNTKRRSCVLRQAAEEHCRDETSHCHDAVHKEIHLTNGIANKGVAEHDNADCARNRSHRREIRRWKDIRVDVDEQQDIVGRKEPEAQCAPKKKRQTQWTD